MAAPLYPLFRVLPFGAVFGILVVLAQILALVLLVVAVLYWLGVDVHQVVWDWTVELLKELLREAAPW
ncbi:hypothetical protein [Natrarchaeobaculum sulfurireducens]|uniref:hypothetical protein n=1 Tax=Natrarchaeobaculum sulfurireducens TaxID=2044521 RepID=UPI000E3C4BDC|nr:hypothetical protein [Natrarchaeobaculum sulfurireducens]